MKTRFAVPVLLTLGACGCSASQPSSPERFTAEDARVAALRFYLQKQGVDKQQEYTLSLGRIEGPNYVRVPATDELVAVLRSFGVRFRSNGPRQYPYLECSSKEIEPDVFSVQVGIQTASLAGKGLVLTVRSAEGKIQIDQTGLWVS